MLHLAHDSDVQLESVAEAPTAKETAALVAKANQRDDLARASGDMKLYGYYFRSVGVFPVCILVAFVIMNVFCNSFGRKYFLL